MEYKNDFLENKTILKLNYDLIEELLDDINLEIYKIFQELEILIKNSNFEEIKNIFNKI